MRCGVYPSDFMVAKSFLIAGITSFAFFDGRKISQDQAVDESTAQSARGYLLLAGSLNKSTWTSLPGVAGRCRFRWTVGFLGCLWFCFAPKRHPLHRHVCFSIASRSGLGIVIHFAPVRSFIAWTLTCPRRWCHVKAVFFGETSLLPTYECVLSSSWTE